LIGFKHVGMTRMSYLLNLLIILM